MKVELRYFSDCPSWLSLEERLQKALKMVHRDDVIVERRTIETIEEAERFEFTGSPTLLIEGHDPFATGDELVGLACRVYSTPTGLAGSPSVEQLVEVLS